MASLHFIFDGACAALPPLSPMGPTIFKQSPSTNPHYIPRKNSSIYQQLFSYIEQKTLSPHPSIKPPKILHRRPITQLLGRNITHPTPRPLVPLRVVRDHVRAEQERES